MASSSVLHIEKQDYLGQEQFNNRTVYIVSKCLAFLVVLSSESVNFCRAKLVATLCYDADDTVACKPVDRVRSEPLIFRSHPHSDGKRATFELRVFALTSQHEEALFRVKFVVQEGAAAPSSSSNGCGAPQMAREHVIFSEPIRVVSKPSLVNKRKRSSLASSSQPSSAARSGMATPSSPGSSPPSSSLAPSPSCEVGGSTSDAVLQALQRIEQQQIRQQHTMDKLASVRPDFETAFSMLMQAYSDLSPEERPVKVRRVAALASAGNGFDELVSSYLYERGADSTLNGFPFLPPSGEDPTSSLPSSPAPTLSLTQKDVEAFYNLVKDLDWSPSEIGL